MKKKLLLPLAMNALILTAAAQNRPAQIPAASGAVPTNPNAVNRPPATGPKPYDQVITKKAKTDNGLFKVHAVEDRFFFEIPDSLLGRDILIVNRISKAAAGVRAGMTGFAGDEIGENVIRFEKGPSNKLFLKSVSYSERSSDTTGMHLSVLNSSIQPIVAAFDVKAYHQDSLTKMKSAVIDMQDYLNGDNDVFFFDSSVKRALGLTSIMPDRSYVPSIRAFKRNIEIKTVKTFMKSPTPIPGQMPAAPGASSPVTYELNSSMVLLSKVPMKGRYYDDRVGYFSTRYVDFDSNPQGVKNIALITRWKLEPKKGEEQKYLNGELVEPANPIVFYIDPATPKKWVPYLIQGVNDWQVAFEQAGFKNAIIAKEAPNDPEWSIDDAAHNAIVYKPSDIPNASGPHVHDPRSGEIIETHVNWYHNVMSLVRNWYMVQASAIDPRARKMTFDDKLMGDLIRFVSSHEIGHTLGLRHNFGSSSTVPVENLRNKKWLEENGHTPSIMDYARFNYVAQPEDQITQRGIYPRIGDYDKWAIEWGYKWMPQFGSAEAETPELNQWIIKRVGANKRLWFGTETDPNDPRSQNEDLGDNAVLASNYGIKNLKRIVPNILEWTKTPNEGYEDARKIYTEVTGQLNRYVGHVIKSVGGTYTTPKSVEEPGDQFATVPYSRQKQAVEFLNAQIFKTPTWLINKPLISKAGVDPFVTIRNLQGNALNRLLSPGTLQKLLNAEAIASAKTYTASELFNDVTQNVWVELNSHQAVDIYRRSLQKAYIQTVGALLKAPSAPSSPAQGQPFFRAIDPTASDISSIARGTLLSLNARIKKAIPQSSGISKSHLIDISSRIKSLLDSDSK